MKNVMRSSAILLLGWFAMMLVGSVLLFFFHIPITKFHLIGTFLFTSTLYYIAARKKNNAFLRVLGLSILVVFASIMISSFLFDRSSDGNTYHKDAIGVLKEGWNPVYGSSENFIESREDDSKNLTNYSIWTDHYAKANWIIGANFYCFTENIESGKAMNLISAYILFSFLFSFLIEFIDRKKAILLSSLTVINPLTASQLLTFYNDQLVYFYLFLAILLLVQLDRNIKDKQVWFLYGLTFIILSNMKFNGLGYLLVFSFLFVCRYLYQAWKKQQLFFTLKKLCLFFVPLFFTALVLVGFPTYIQNTLDHHNPFFPLYDKNGEDIITFQQPKSFATMNTLQKLFYATFSKANNLRENDHTTLKIPFTVSKEELTPAMSNDLRISGWGIFFSGLLLVSIGIFIYHYQECKKENVILYLLGITVFLLLIMSESWWARYTPHFYLLIVLALYLLFRYEKKKWITVLYTILVSMNTLLPFAGNAYFTLKNSISILKDFTTLQNQEIVVNEKGMNGIIYNLKDFHIPYSIDSTLQGKELYYHYLEYQEKRTIER